jgi:hypothetical protein
MQRLATRRPVGPLILLSALIGALVIAGCSDPTAARPLSRIAAPRTLATVLATYPGGNTIGAEPREKTARADGYHHIDTPTTIAQLKRLHVNTYVYLVFHSPSDWEDLTHDLLPAAQKAGINVWVYVVPPTECTPERCSYPYKTDYVAWAKAVAQQSLKFPNLTGWVIDDFAGGTNLKLLTPRYAQQVHDTGAKINRGLLFMTLLYSAQITPKFFSAYGPAIDAAVFAFDDAPVHDTQWAATLRPQLDRAISASTAAKKPLVLMTYVNRLTAAPLLPTVLYVSEVFNTGLQYVRDGRLAGMVAYGTPLEELPALSTEKHARTGIGRLSLGVNRYGPTASQGYAEASQTVHVQSSATHGLQFWHQNRYSTTKAYGARRLQLLVDGKVVFDHDNSADPAGKWIHESVDLNLAVAGKTTAKLTFRLIDTRVLSGVFADVSVDDLQSTGLLITDPGFESLKAWGVSRSGGPFLPAIDVFDAQRPTHVFNAVRDAYVLATAP